ncbi:MAG: phosphotransferase family protein [Pyrinomonadaceae bacterium]
MDIAETKPVRPGEEIDVERLRTFLGQNLGVSDGEIVVEQFPAGSSNLTYLIRLGHFEYVLRRPPFGNTVRSAHDMGREFNVLSKLSVVYAPAPKPLLFCENESVIGSQLYIMERRHGLIVRGKFPGTFLPKPAESEREPNIANLGTIRTESLKEVARSFISNLADLHTLDYAAAGLETLGHSEGYNRRQVEGWSKRYFAAKTDEHPELETAIGWLNKNVPAEFGTSLIHNDYKFDNVMLDPDDLTRITAVLDWEMVTVGNPLMDLGTTLGYWMSADAGEEMLNMPFNPRVLMENISRHQLVDMYANAFGRALPDMVFYYVFGTFKIAVICQQIYARFMKGFTTDQRFAGFGTFVGRLGRIASSAIEKQSI